MTADIQSLGIALALGLLVGLERESNDPKVAGIRTFALITLLGAVAGILEPAGSWGLLAVGWICLSLELVAVNIRRWSQGDGGYGLTTEIAVLVMFAVGYLLPQGHLVPALIVAGIVVVLLHHKERMHAFVDRLGEADLGAVAKLALIGLVVLPALPDRAHGPYGVLNPREIWMMVVLIAGISVAAYLVQRLLGARVGAVLGGVLGGLISSTAATVSYARQAKAVEGAAPLAALGILIASTVVQVRVAIEVAVASPTLLETLAWPLTIMTLVMIVECVLIWWLVSRKDTVNAPEPGNPAQLGAAIVFGLLYAGVLLGVATVRDHFGSDALYVVAAISGLTDVDAITLSTARLFETGEVEASTAWRVIILAVMSNLVFKGGAAWVLGGNALRTRVVAQFAIAVVAGALLLWLWPV